MHVFNEVFFPLLSLNLNFFSTYKSSALVCVSFYMILAQKAKKQLVYPSKTQTQEITFFYLQDGNILFCLFGGAEWGGKVS